MLWLDRGGTGPRTLLLLHGLGATAAVWSGVQAALRRRTEVRWITVDLPGHGGSAWEPHYSVGSMTARIAEDCRDAGPLYVVGHSLGVYLGLALASGWFGVTVRAPAREPARTCLSDGRGGVGTVPAGVGPWCRHRA
jgi:pimeloyl-ACP methyl ester carboxylesterase